MSETVIVKLYSGEAIIARWPEKTENKDPYGMNRTCRKFVKPLGVQYRILAPSGKMQPTLVSWAAEEMFLYDDAIMGVGPAPAALEKAYIEAISGLKLATAGAKLPSPPPTA